MGTTTASGYYKPAHNETGWDALVNANWDLVEGIQTGNGMAQVATKPPTELSNAILVVGTTAVLLSTVSGGIPAGATHAVISNLHSSNTIYYTLFSSATPVATSGSEVGTPLTSQDVAEVQNLSDIKVISTAATTRMNIAFRKYV